MDCSDVQRQLRARALLGPEAHVHLAGCPACAELSATAPRLPLPADAGADASDRALWVATMAEVDREHGPLAWLRERSSPLRLVLALLLASSAPVVVVLVTPRADLGAYPSTRLAFELAALALAAMLAIAVTLRPLQSAMTPTLRGAALVLAVLTAAILASLPAAHVHGPLGPTELGGFVVHAVSCLAFGSLCALPTWFALRLLAREGAALGQRARVLAAAAFVIGVAAVFLHCPQLHRDHLWAGHMTIVVPLLLWAWWNARRGPSRVG
jgi:hypothetical protein